MKTSNFIYSPTDLSYQGRMRILAAIVQPEIIARILTHRGLPARAPPIEPPDPELLEASTPDLP